MLQFTSERLHQTLVDGDQGEPIAFSSIREQNAAVGGQAAYNVPIGQVLLLTSITLQADPTKADGVLTFPTHSPAANAYGFAAGNNYAMQFLSQHRRVSQFDPGVTTPTARSAPPGNVVVWHLKYPIPIPAATNVLFETPLGGIGAHGGCSGVLVPESHARSLGFNVNPTAASSRHHAAFTLGNTSPTTFITGRTGKSIRILDMHVRLQPGTITANTLTLQQVDGVKVFQWVCGNSADMIDQAFSPDEVFLKAGQGLQVQSTVANVCSVNVVYEYVNEDEVPHGAFFAWTDPAKPGTGADPILFGGFQSNVAVEVYYPRTGTTGLLPGKGHQFLVRGAQVSIQKKAGTYASSLLAPEQTFVTISAGAAAGNIQFSGAVATAQVNPQIIPVLHAGQHHQNVQYLHDRLNFACDPDDGGIWINSLGLARGNAVGGIIGDVLTNDDDITAWSFTVWGRAIANRWRGQALRGL